jgi:hypothetical protein
VPKEPKGPDNDLPLTSEVGDEGGTYTDPIVQKATRDGDLPRVDEAQAHPASRVGQHAAEATPTPDDAADGVHFERQPDQGGK